MQLIIAPITADDTLALRQSVLWPDKPIEAVRLPNDGEGHHIGAFVDGQLIAVISLFVEGERAQFRKFATHPNFQGQGIGSLLLNHVIDKAKQLNANRLCCDARLIAASFYARRGMQPLGDVFYKGPIPYQQYQCLL
ncbi:GNAT family N-acetyltransferase [Fibrella sp. HMF5335]|uniref:GNAT family N-acetyltransferase n=1 Tax=Fibrella rubiginis TaxID=2817060 RepID=A0A939GJP1_9BACT|nr:GNAT family N-acetyltransferase [Fibrella rubiginis]MBO0939043.1 GNAT family N-acetyltransferase [Fibrella rubiginis]